MAKKEMIVSSEGLEKLKQELGAVSEERAHALHASEKDR